MLKYTILIVDDEPAQRETLSGYLKKKSFEVLKAENGQQGLEVFQVNPVDSFLFENIKLKISAIKTLTTIPIKPYNQKEISVCNCTKTRLEAQSNQNTDEKE